MTTKIKIGIVGSRNYTDKKKVKAKRYFKENCVEHAAIASVLFDEYRPVGI